MTSSMMFPWENLGNTMSPSGIGIPEDIKTPPNGGELHHLNQKVQAMFEHKRISGRQKVIEYLLVS